MKDLSLAIAVADLRPEEIRALYEVAGGENPRRLGPAWKAARQKLLAALGADESPRAPERRGRRSK
jgi:hypothetical protein